MKMVIAFTVATAVTLVACFRFVVPAAPAPIVKVVPGSGEGASPKFVDGDPSTQLWACYHEKGDREHLKCFEFRRFYQYLGNRFSMFDGGMQL